LQDKKIPMTNQLMQGANNRTIFKENQVESYAENRHSERPDAAILFVWRVTRAIVLMVPKKDALLFSGHPGQWHLEEGEAEKMFPRNRIYDVKIVSEAHFSSECYVLLPRAWDVGGH
jgi:hypothetical protein